MKSAMKRSPWMHALALGLALSTAPAFAHDTESRVALEPEAEGSVAAGSLNFQFQLVDTKLNKVLTDADLLVDHEKKLHFFAFDPALVEFHHVHPTFNGTVWEVALDLPVNGNYWVWAQGQLASDQTEFAGGNRLLVTGGKPENALPEELGDLRTGSDQVSVATIAPGKIVAKKMVMLTLSFSRTDGTPAQLTDYLGAPAHLTITPIDGDSLIHAHPMNMGGSLMIHTTFPEAGDYRIWVQFMDGGTLRTVPLSVRVDAQ